MSSAEGDPGPPVKYAHAAPKGEELEQWKTSILAMIDKRVDLYPRIRHPIRTSFDRLLRALAAFFRKIPATLYGLLFVERAGRIAGATSGAQDQQLSDPVQRVVVAAEWVGHIPELVENILRFADPATQIRSAWNTSFAWRQTAAGVIARSQGPDSFQGTRPYGAVEEWQARPTEFALAGRNPTIEEMQNLQRDVALSLATIRRRPGTGALNKGIRVPIFPTRITCSTLLPRSTVDSYNELRACSMLRNHTCAAGVQGWHEFTQLRINPYLSAVFQGIVLTDRGTLEIKLRPQSHVDNLLFPCAKPPALRDVVWSMQLSQPPCKVVDVSVQVPYWCFDGWKTYPSGDPVDCSHEATYDGVQQIEKISNNDGVTCGQIIEVLESRTIACLLHWQACAAKLRTEVETMEEFTDLWCLSGAPKFVLRLGQDTTNGSESWKQADRHRPLVASSVIERQLEWLPMDLVRVEEYTEIRDGKIYHYPADLEH
ncbi:uncharacterized protein J4E84_005122 [Alternaria hordeiaustralica]|uniref:uncharacterized protein n=1 Tax=Alternaria hordeiaustralica TaxID=1187925 RepID=UPI0020C43444|nr:uncharacterized protein J4E84_005122 [Alternaria hordeiaustralica]KAI4688193.1 hypothetical protein J4E84_005122 [Alternaria hordeiaustralica]